jgi:hypothetical protein
MQNLRQRFDGCGYVILRGVLPPSDVDDFATQAELLRAIQDEAHKALKDPPAKVRVALGANWIRILGGYETLLKVQLNPRLRSALQEILDDEPVARFTFFLPTSPGATDANREKDGHPHLHIVGSESRPRGKRLIVWCPIDDVLMKAGPMWIAPGSHKVFATFADDLLAEVPNMFDELKSMWKTGAPAEAWLAWNERLFLSALEFLCRYMRDSYVEREPVLLNKGDVIIFSNSLVHGTYLAEDPSLPRRAFYTHYHASSCELWDLGDGIGSQANPDRIRNNREWTETKYGLTYPSCMYDYYSALQGFFR